MKRLLPVTMMSCLAFLATCNNATAMKIELREGVPIVDGVSVNGHGPYRFLLDTGASNTVLSAAVADSLGIPKGRVYTLSSAGGNVAATVRTLAALTVGSGHLQNVDVAVANFDLMKTMKVDGVLGGDYLRKFKVSIDYDNQVVEIEPCCPETMSRLYA